jgi:hypothetical protein
MTPKTPLWIDSNITLSDTQVWPDHLFPTFYLQSSKAAENSPCLHGGGGRLVSKSSGTMQTVVACPSVDSPRDDGWTALVGDYSIGDQVLLFENIYFYFYFYFYLYFYILFYFIFLFLFVLFILLLLQIEKYSEILLEEI